MITTKLKLVKYFFACFTLMASALIFNACGDDDDEPLPPPSSSVASPTGLSASQSGTTVALSWNSVSGAASYNVYHSTTSSGHFNFIGNIAATGAVHNSPSNGLNYYRITAQNSAGQESSPSSTVSVNFTGGGGGDGGNTAVTFSSVTANGSSSQTTTQLTLTFSQAIAGLSASDITLSGVSGVVKGTLSGSGTSYTLGISGFTSGGTLTVGVSKSGFTISNSSRTVTIFHSSGGSGGTTIPSTPTGLSASQSGSTVLVSWSSVSGATSYRVYRSSSSSGIYTQIGTPIGTSFTDSSPLTGNNSYRVSAVNSAGESSQSSPVSVNFTSGGGVTIPNAPTSVTASRTPRSSEYVTISWNAVSGATSYRIYYSMSANGNYQWISTATGTSSERFFHNDLTSYWKVTAVNTAGESALSSSYGTALGWQSAGGGGTTTQKLATPTGLQAYSGGSFVQISFTPVALANSYELHRATSATGTYSRVTATGGSSGNSYVLTDSSPRTGTSFYKVRAIPLASMTNLTASDLSNHVSVTR